MEQRVGLQQLSTASNVDSSSKASDHHRPLQPRKGASWRRASSSPSGPLSPLTISTAPSPTYGCRRGSRQRLCCLLASHHACMWKWNKTQKVEHDAKHQQNAIALVAQKAGDLHSAFGMWSGDDSCLRVLLHVGGETACRTGGSATNQPRAPRHRDADARTRLAGPTHRQQRAASIVPLSSANPHRSSPPPRHPAAKPPIMNRRQPRPRTVCRAIHQFHATSTVVALNDEHGRQACCAERLYPGGALRATPRAQRRLGLLLLLLQLL